MKITCKNCSTEIEIAPIKGLYYRMVCEDCIKCNNPDYKEPYFAIKGNEEKFCSSDCANKK